VSGRLQGALLVECAEWTWEQLRDEGTLVDGELVELVLRLERELGVQAAPHPLIASAVLAELARRDGGGPLPIDETALMALLSWEDEFLGLAAIPRAES
jgi:hypothetical protein